MQRSLAFLMLIFTCFMTPLATAEVRGDLDQAAAAWEQIEDGALIIDVRSDEEWAAGHLPGAIHVPYEDTDALIKALGTDLNQAAVFYCGSGRRAGKAIEALEEAGYTTLFNASGLDALEATSPAKP